MVIDYSIKLMVGSEIGSGILFVPDEGEYVYIITVAHLFKDVDTEFEVKIEFVGIAFENVENMKRTYVCELNNWNDIGEKKRVFFLPGYNRNEEDSPDDAAVIELTYEAWMKRGNIRLGSTKEGRFVEGYGHPKGGENKRIRFEGDIESTVKENIKLGEDGDYILEYNPKRYADELAIDKSYLDGFSGTGLLEERTGEYYCIGVFSRSMKGMPRVYLTDIRKIENLIQAIRTKRNERVLPIVKVKMKDDKGDSEITDDVLNALNVFLKDANRFIMCLHGYVGVGKTFAIEEIRKQYNEIENGEIRVETSWRRLVDCLNADSMKKLKDTIYIFDCMESVWDKKERTQISFLKQKKEDVQYRRLNAEEKEAFFNKIWERERELKANNIHILIVFRTNFLKDLKEYIYQKKQDRRWTRIEDTFVNCIGYSEGQVLETFGKECPDYIIQGEMTKRPLWMKYILEKRHILERDFGQVNEKNQYVYEFHLIRDTLDWYIKKEGPNKDTNYFAQCEEEALELIKKEYIRFILRYEDKEPYAWNKKAHPLIWCYPFEENTSGFKMDDIVLYAFFVATELYELAKHDERLEFKEHFLKAYHISARNNLLGDRIIAFFRLLMIEDDNSRFEDVLILWMDDCLECMKWYAGTPTNDYYYLDKMYVNNKNENENEYLNVKEEIVRENYITQNDSYIEDGKSQMVNKEQSIGVRRKRRT